MSISIGDHPWPQPSAAVPQPLQPTEAAGTSAAGAGPRWQPSPELGARELIAVVVAAVALAVLATWPLALHISTRISPDLGDPIRTAWQVAWVGHGLLTNPLHVFDANAFFPRPLSLAFSDSLLGYGPAGFLGSGTVAALVRYNLIFLFIWALCFLGTYLLARELGARSGAAAVAGVAFAYAPYRATEAGHFQVISSGGIALALFLLVRGYRRDSWGLVLAGWLVSAWQLSLGWTLGLQYSYLLGVLALLVLWHRWRGSAAAKASGSAAGRWRLSVLVASCVGAAAFGGVGVLQSIPYERVATEYSTAARSIAEVRKYSAGPAALIAAPSSNPVWGAATASLRADVPSATESVFFPGLVIGLLALAGIVSRAGNPYTARMRLGLAGGAIVCAVLALGLGLGGAGYPFRLLHDIAPGWNGVRVPGRIFTLTTLALALLAAAGAQSLLGRLGRWAGRTDHDTAGGVGGDREKAAGGRWAGAPTGLIAPLVALALVAAILAEGTRQLPEHVVPQPASAEAGVRQPVLDLPTDQPDDRLWQYYSTDGFYRIANGDSTFDIPALDDLRGAMRHFPNAASVNKLHEFGIHTVILHTDVPSLPGLSATGGPEPADPSAAAEVPVAGLGLTRRQVGSIVIYEVGHREGIRGHSTPQHAADRAG